MKGIIYKATNIVNNKSYIGQTIRPLAERKAKHIHHANKGVDLVFYRAIRKYGKDSFKWEIIDTGLNKEELDKKEEYYINYYNTFAYGKDSNGYNMTMGGEGCYGRPMSEEHKEIISKTHKGKTVSEETRRKMSESANHKGKLNPMYGKKHSNKSIELNRKNQPATKQVIQLTLEGEFVTEHNSIADGARAVNGDGSAINKVCKGKQKHHKGFKWILKDEYKGRDVE